MLTNRGRWLLLIVVCGLGLGLFKSRPLLATTSLALLMWIGFEWILFRWRTEIRFHALECQRYVNDQPPGPMQTTTLWVSRPVKMTVRILNPRGMRLPFVRFTDYVPESMRVTDGDPTLDATLSSSTPISEWSYTCKPLAAGEATWPGVTVRIFDLHGLFFCQKFLPGVPTTAESHVVRGSSFRILPLCTRLDAPRPMKKRMNSVPPPGIHRCPQIGMGSELLELRPYQTGDPPKSIAWKVSARKDALMTRQYESEVPIRATIFLDGCRGTRLGPFGRRPIDQCITLAAGLVEALMSDRDPAGLVLYHDAGTKVLRPKTGQRHFYDTLDQLARFAASPNRPRAIYTTKLMNRVCSTAEILYPGAMDRRIARLPFFVFPAWLTNRSTMRRRLQVGYLFKELYDLGADAPVQMAYDDVMFAVHADRFLWDHGIAWVGPNYDAKGHNLYESSFKMNILHDAIIHSVSRAKDNELLVVMVDLIDHTPRLYELISAIRLARAKHHRVVVICPWPTVADFYGDSRKEQTARIVARAEKIRLEKSAKDAMSAIRRLGVPVAFATETRAAQLVIAEAELARSGRGVSV